VRRGVVRVSSGGPRRDARRTTPGRASTRRLAQVRDLEVERSSDLASLSFADDDWEASANDEGAGQLMADAGAAADDWAPPPPTVAVAGEKTEGGLFLS